MMIPVDFKIARELREHNHQRFVYTRYADDFQISSKYSFSFMEIQNVIVSILKEFDAPFTIKSEKTRYGSSAGQNWNLGLMLNKDNKITVGYKKKRQFQAMLSSYIMDKKMESHGIKTIFKQWRDIEIITIWLNLKQLMESLGISARNSVWTSQKQLRKTLRLRL